MDSTSRIALQEENGHEKNSNQLEWLISRLYMVAYALQMAISAERAASDTGGISCRIFSELLLLYAFKKKMMNDFVIVSNQNEE